MKAIKIYAMAASAVGFLFGGDGYGQEAYRDQRRLNDLTDRLERCASIEKIEKENAALRAGQATSPSTTGGPDGLQSPGSDLCDYVAEAAASSIAYDERTVWTEKPTTVADAVWEAVFVPLNDEKFRSDLRRERESAERNQARRNRARRGETSVAGDGDRPRTDDDSIERRLALSAGLQQAEIDLLREYAVEAVHDEGENTGLIRKQVICDRLDSFETPAAYGRAFAASAAAARSDRGNVVAGLDERLGAEAARKVESYALSTVGSTIRTTDVANGVAQLPPAELKTWIAFFCARN